MKGEKLVGLEQAYLVLCEAFFERQNKLNIKFLNAGYTVEQLKTAQRKAYETYVSNQIIAKHRKTEYCSCGSELLELKGDPSHFFCVSTGREVNG